MYLCFSVLFLIFLCFFLFGIWRKKRIIRKICCMNREERCCKVNELIAPFGYCYNCGKGVFSSRLDAWQREFGFCGLYDRTAPEFHMIYDCEPIYFDYQGKTWLLELWKGQYGINIGGEIGLYCANTTVDWKERGNVLFHSADDDELLKFTIRLRNEYGRICTLSQRHWWLAGFCLGSFAQPETLAMDVCITFRDYCMLQMFLNSLLQIGYSEEEISVCGHTVQFTFDQPRARQPRTFRPWKCAYAQWLNQKLVRLFQRITKPFPCGGDKILYIYYYLPFIFRRMLCNRKHHQWKRSR